MTMLRKKLSRLMRMPLLVIGLPLLAGCAGVTEDSYKGYPGEPAPDPASPAPSADAPSPGGPGADEVEGRERL